jgi:hypothetical protein
VDCETLMLAHLLLHRLIDGGEAVSLTRSPPFTTMKISATHFSYRMNRNPYRSAVRRI